MADRLKEKQIEKKLKDLNDGWKIDNGHLRREFEPDDFKTALLLTVKIGGIAEKQNHHPNICLTWGEVVVEIWTHEVDGLTEKDFKLAWEIDNL